MKNICHLILFLCLLVPTACSKDDDTQEGGTTPLTQPEISVRAVSTTGFTLQWVAVENAVSYRYSLNDGEEVETSDCRLVLSGLEKQTEYAVAVKACTTEAGYTESPYTYVHVVTDDIEQLSQPKILLGSAYSAHTIISWTDVPEASGYEYTINGKSAKTSERQVSLTTLSKSQGYTFTIRALTGDATRYTDSEDAALEFTTDAEDVPALLIVPTDVISDAVAYSVYATSDITYFYDVVPATWFTRYSADDLVALYRQAALDYAAKQGISIQLAMASLMKAGTQSMTLTGLTPELSYEILAFGMDLKGNVTTSLYNKRFKTTANGYSAGPNYGGSTWFTQSFYISNAYAALGYNWTNSVWTLWRGQDVARIRYRTLPTSTYRRLFPTDSDTDSVKAFLKDDDYAYEAPEAYIATTNSSMGNNMVSTASMGVSYTLAALAISTSGEETLCVNSTTTKTSTTSGAWFQVSAYTDAQYGETYDKALAAMQGVNVASCHYALFTTSALAEIPTSSYAAVVEKYGNVVAESALTYLNGNGYAIRFKDLTASTSYTFIASVTNTVGDKLTKYATVSTTAAPATEPLSLRTRTSVTEPLTQSLQGEPISSLSDFIYPMPLLQLPTDAKADGDVWTTIHNMQILNQMRNNE